MYKVERSAIVAYSAAQMYQLVTDIESYGEFLPWCSGAKILDEKDSGVVHAEIGINIAGVKQRFSTENINKVDQTVEMRLLNGPFSHLHGVWMFTALDANASRIELNMQFDFSNRLIAKMVAPTFGKICENFIGAFQKRADHIYGSKN